MSSPKARIKPIGVGKLTTTEKKIRKRARDCLRDKCKISIGDNIDRWRAVKAEEDMKTDADLAKFLLLLYQTKPKVKGVYPQHLADSEEKLEEVCTDHADTPNKPFWKTSTPMETHTHDVMHGSSGSGLSGEISQLSGVNPLLTGTTGSDVPQATADQQAVNTSFFDMKAGDRCLNIREVKRSAACKEVCEVESDQSDIEELYLADITGEPLEGDDRDITYDPLDTEEDDDSGDTDYEPTPKKIRLDTSPEIYLGGSAETVDQLHEAGPLYLVYEGNLKSLAEASVPAICTIPSCRQKYSLQVERGGTAAYITWVCPNGHANTRWCSQPKFAHGVHTADLHMATAVVISGNNFDKINMFLDCLRVPCLEKTLFHGFQRNFIVPAINSLWEKTNSDTLEKYKNQEVIISGDGRNDSPGHSAQYCTYTCMSHPHLDILSMVIVDKRETGGKSVNMEALAFRKSLRCLLSQGINVVEVITDQHPVIISIMKKEFGPSQNKIKHSFDIWHVAKNLLKHLMKAAATKKCKDITKWAPDIVRHYWWVCQNCQEDVPLFKEMWRGILHHVRGRHEWLAADGSSVCCQHSADFEERKEDLLKADSPAFAALQKVILKPKFLREVPYFIRYRHTSDLEAFNDLILKYCAKRYAFTPPVYQARNELAALDYMANNRRENLINKDGKPRLARRYNKKTKRWIATNVKVPKSYKYLTNLMTDIVERKITQKISSRQSKQWAPEDPRRLNKTLGPSEAATTSQLYQKRQSRFKLKEAAAETSSKDTSDA